MPFLIYIIEDDAWYGEMLKYHLSHDPENQVILFNNATDLFKNLHQKPDLIFSDFGLPDMTGSELLKKVKQSNNQIPVAIISAQDQVGVAVELLRSGAYDYIVKDENARDQLWNTTLKVKEMSALRKEVEELKEQLVQKFSFEKSIIGQSPAIRQVHKLTEKAIKTNVNILITGETGTGKEVVAKAIHFNSDRNKKPFIAVNMAAIPSELIESELFGHEKGAFTGADAQKPGKFEQANGGTLFLDEIAELDLSLQSKLLRVLQERELTRVGGSQKIKLDFRLVSATHQNLSEAVRKGTFREDLYYRIIGFPIDLPALRNRDLDTLILSRHFAEEFAKENKIKALTFSEDAQKKLLSYPFPGNVRELKSVIDLACVMADGKEIQLEDLSFNPVQAFSTIGTSEKTMDDYYAEIIQSYLDKYNHNVLLVADKLKIGKSTIYKMIQTNQLITK